MKRCHLFIAIFFLGLNLSAQFYSEGQNSWRLQWRQIKTENFQLIYEEGYELKAQEIAGFLDSIIAYATLNLKVNPKRISIILQTQTSYANGFVTLAPRRSEFFTMPPQNNSGVNWIEELAIHEYRHVVQVDKLNKGIGRLMYVLFGEQGVGALLGLTTPLWWLEGDAVDFETNYSTLGRGEFGDFLQEMKAQIAAPDSFSYDKAMFGSYKDYVTNHYKLGYHLVAFARSKYGTQVWDKVLQGVAKNPFIPYPFSYHLKKITGKTSNELYKEFHHFSDSIWKRSNTTINQVVLTTESKEYVNYSFPMYYMGKLYSLKQSYSSPPVIVCIDSLGNDDRLHMPGNIDLSSVNLGGGIISWAEKRVHPRWQYKDYSEVITYNIKTRKRKRVKRKTRWFSPAISPSGKNLCAVSIGKDEQVKLVFYSLEEEKIIKEIKIEKGMAYHPSWISDNAIVFVNQNRGENELITADITGTMDVVYQTEEELSYPKAISKESFIVNSTYGNKNVIIHVNTFGSTSMIVNSKFGVRYPCYVSKSNKVIYSDYTSKGYRLASSKIENKFTIDGPSYNSEYYARKLKEVNASFDVLNHNPIGNYKSKKYYPLLHLFNFHSWAPVSIKPNEEKVNLGATLFSQNKLSSSIVELNYDYNYYTEENQVNLKYSFERYFPTFSLQAIKVWDENVSVQGEEASLYQEHLAVSSAINLNLTNNNFNKRLFARASYINSKFDLRFKTVELDTVIVDDKLSYVLAFSSRQKMAKQNIIPKWGYNIQARFEHVPDRLDSTSSKLAMDFYLPGFYKNHGIKISNEIQLRDSSILFSNSTKVPRGYNNLTNTAANFTSIEYFFPIWYPDLKLSKLAYIQRFTASVFYDHMIQNESMKKFSINNLFQSNNEDVLQSFGVTLRMDFNAFRFPYPIKAGVDIAFNKREGKYIPILAPSLSFSY